jgi:hypothetical protein
VSTCPAEQLYHTSNGSYYEHTQHTCQHSHYKLNATNHHARIYASKRVVCAVKNCCANFFDLRNTVQYGYFITRVVICSPPPCQKSELPIRYHRQKNTRITPKQTHSYPLLHMRPPFYSIVSSRTVRPVRGEGDPYPQHTEQQSAEIDIHPAHSSIDPLLEGVCVIVGYSVGYSPPVFLIILSASSMRISHWAQLPCTFSAMARVFMALLSAYSGASDRLPLTVMFW